MKILEKKKILVVSIVIVSVCLCTIFYWRQRIGKSVLGEMKIQYACDMDKVRLAQEDFFAAHDLSGRDKLHLFSILSSTRKYDKKRDKSYLLDGSFLYSPKVYFDFDNDRYTIYWKYDSGIIYCEGTEGKEESYYYLEEDNAAKLKELYEKYIDL